MGFLVGRYYSTQGSRVQRFGMCSLRANYYLGCLLFCSLTFFGGLWGHGDRVIWVGMDLYFIISIYYTQTAALLIT